MTLDYWLGVVAGLGSGFAIGAAWTSRGWKKLVRAMIASRIGNAWREAGNASSQCLCCGFTVNVEDMPAHSCAKPVGVLIHPQPPKAA